MSMTIVTINDNKGCGSSYLTLQRSKRLGGGAASVLFTVYLRCLLKRLTRRGGRGVQKIFAERMDEQTDVCNLGYQQG